MKFAVCIVTISCFLCCSISSVFGGPMKGRNVQYTSLQEVPEAVWKKLAMKKIYFGHQSVGFDILQGVQELLDQYSFIPLRISDNLNKENIQPGTIVNSLVGKNKNPISKIDDFHRILKSIGGKVDVAGFKFCFVDIENPDDNNMILNHYINCINEVKKEFPDLIIIHFTVPLMSIKLSWKDRIKKVLGRKIDDNSLENVARNEYNAILRKQLGDDALLFDIATVESTFADGSRCTFSRDGKTYFSMVPEYTYDGGHLTQLGRKIMAEQFLLFLASIN